MEQQGNLHIYIGGLRQKKLKVDKQNNNICMYLHNISNEYKATPRKFIVSHFIDLKNIEFSKFYS